MPKEYALLNNARKLNQSLASLEVSKLINLGLRRERPVGRPEIDQGLHRLQVLLAQHIQRRSRKQKVWEAAVQLLLQVEVVVRFGKVCPVEMSIHSEHLAEYHLTNVKELFWESRSLARPVALSRVGELRQRSWRHGRVMTIRDASRIGWEGGGIINLSGDPSLHKSHVLMSR